jgi:hypothetical protein
VKILTSSWATKLPDTYARIGISRSVPRGYPAGYKRLKELEPGAWLRSVDAIEYHARYMNQLDALDVRALVGLRSLAVP